MNIDKLIETDKVHYTSSSLFPSLSNRVSPMRTPQRTSPKSSRVLFSRSEKLPSLYGSLSPRGFAKATHKKLEKIRQNPTKVTVANCGKVKIIAGNSHTGLKRSHNEDRIKILQNIEKPHGFTEEKWPKTSFYGLFDGHSGKFCADYLKENLHSSILNENNFPHRLKQAITNAFEQTDADFLRISEEENDLSGSSALISLIIGNRCFIANCGDSRAILSANKGSKIIQISEEHTPLNDCEYERIISANGKMISDFVIENGVKVEKGPCKVIPGNLHISRCFGDFPAKIQKFGGNPRVIIPTPSVKNFTVTENHDFILLCSSGFFDRLSCCDVVESVWRGFHMCMSENISEKIAAGVDELMREAISKRCAENFTVVLIAFKSFCTE